MCTNSTTAPLLACGFVLMLIKGLEKKNCRNLYRITPKWEDSNANSRTEK